jgi:hypothetical protein
MSNEWLIEECRDAVVLCAAVKVFRATLGDQTRDLTPPSGILLPAITRIAGQFQRFIQKELGSAEAIVRRSAGGDIISLQVAGDLANEAISAGDVIEWWLRAASTLSECKRRMPKESALSLRPMKQLLGKKKGAAASEVRGSEKRLRAVFDVVSQELAGGAISWCCDYQEQFGLSVVGFLQPPPGNLFELQRHLKKLQASTREQVLAELVRWCGHPLRPQPKLKNIGKKSTERMVWCRQYKKMMYRCADAASKLFDEKCCLRDGADLAVANSRQWKLFQPGFLGDAFHVLSFPLVLSEQSEKLIDKGRLILPTISSLVQRLRETVEHPQRASGFEQGVVRAVESFAPLEQSVPMLSALPPWQKREDSISLAELAGSILSPGRLLFSLSESSADGGRVTATRFDAAKDPLFAVVFGLHVDGFQLLEEPADSLGERIIPSGKTKERADSPIATHRLECQGVKLLLGNTVVSKQPLRSQLLDAMADLDWTIWFLNWAHGQSGKLDLNPIEAAGAGRACECLEPRRWERLKRQVLSAPDELDAIRQAVEYLQAVRLQLGKVSNQLSSLGFLQSRLAEGVQACERAFLEEAHRLDPDTGAGAFPPRRRDGTIDLGRLVRRPWSRHEQRGRWRFEWQPDRIAVGEPLRETLEDRGFVKVLLSAGTLSEQDIEILNAPFIFCSSSEPGREYSASLHGFGTKICERISIGRDPGIGQALKQLRGHFLTETGRQHFNQLIRCAINHHDGQAMDWLEVLMRHEEFSWECYPAIIVSDGGAETPAIAPEDNLRWVDSESIPVDTVVEDVYSIDWGGSLRTLSRGLPRPLSAEFVAEEIVAHVSGKGEPVQKLAGQLQLATDLRRCFGERSPHPAAVALPCLLDHLVLVSSGDNAFGAELFKLVAEWCDAVGHKLVPATWQPEFGSPSPLSDRVAAAETNSGWDVRFHPTVPSGNLVVESFGIAGEHHRDEVAHVSAGPAPAGYEQVLRDLSELAETAEIWNELGESLEEFPRRVLAGKQHLAGPAIFDAVWRGVLTVQHSRNMHQQLIDGVAEVLRDACQMTTFSPASVGDFPSDWVCDRDGSPARGTWIARVVRPGLRTSKNTLVWPAIVETE